MNNRVMTIVSQQMALGSIIPGASTFNHQHILLIITKTII